MPRYFFDTHDGGHFIDEVGTECADFDAARREAMHALPEIAKFAIPADGDQQRYVVLVRDQSGTVVYTATLEFSGLCMTHASVADRQSVATPSSTGSHPTKL